MSYKGTFDYLKVWDQLVRPEYEGLSSEIHALLGLVLEKSKDLRQDKNLKLPWISDLKERFEALSTIELSKASRVIFSYGYWTTPQFADWIQKNGIYWKFSTYADQVLYERIGIERTNQDLAKKKRKFQWSLSVHEGMLRVQYSDNESWQWKEIGWALEGAPEVVLKHLKSTYVATTLQLNATETLDILQKTYGMEDPDCAKWLNATKNYVEK
ncbi:MAG: hypothetical protein GY861_00405 [bacterium]|nr:hypothetical protein [bacterium]